MPVASFIDQDSLPEADPASGADPNLVQRAVAAGVLVSVAACSGGEQPPASFFETADAATAPTLLRKHALAQAGPAFAAPDPAALFDWAESLYANFFPEPQVDRVQAPYVYRHYPSTGNYVGVAGDDVYVLGPLSGDVLLHVGKLADFAASVHSDVRPIDPEDAAAVRLLLQSQFSASDTEVAQVRRLGSAAWIGQQMSLPRGRTGVQWLDHRGCYDTSVRKGFYGTVWSAQWMAWNQMLTAPDAVRARVALALTEYFVVGINGVGGTWISYMMAAYWDTLAENAFGNFRSLLEKVTLNLAMGTYLNTVWNRKEDAIGRQPDENYAREVMQLFTIGLYELNADGSEKRDAQGKPIETYTNSDVTNLARVFTGYEPMPDPGPRLQSDDPRQPTLPTRAPMINPMVLVPFWHSTLESRFLGTVIPAGTDGTVALRMALDTLFKHPNVGPFFARQMIQRLIVSNPSPSYVQRVAAVFNDNGRSVRGDLRAVFSAIWLDDEARGQGSTEASRIGKVREPIVRVAQLGRTFASEELRNRWNSAEKLWIDMGVHLNQSPLNAPSVFNFFRPGYVPPSTPLASRGWVAPEFQIIDEASVGIYLNWIGRTIRLGFQIPLTDEVWTTEGQYVGSPWRWDPIEYKAELPMSPFAGALVRRLNLLLCAGALPDDAQRLMIDALNATPVTPASSKEAKLDRIAAAVMMVLACPEYIVQH